MPTQKKAPSTLTSPTRQALQSRSLPYMAAPSSPRSCRLSGRLSSPAPAASAAGSPSRPVRRLTRLRPISLSLRPLSLLLSLLLILLYALRSLHIISPPCAISSSDLFPSCLLFHFFHSNILHLASNLYALLTIAFLWHGITIRHLVLAFISSTLAALLAVILIPTPPSIGLSAVIYAITGLRSLYPATLSARLRYNGIILASILLTGLLPHISLTLHLSSYLSGTIFALIFLPIPHIQKPQK